MFYFLDFRYQRIY